MTVVHIVEPFVSGIAVFVRLLAESMPADCHIIVHGERADLNRASEVKKTFRGLNVRFVRWHSAQRSLHPVKDTRALSELVTILKRLKRSKRIDAVHLHSSKSGFLGRIACKMTGIRQVLYTPNGASFLAASNPLSRILYSSLEKFGNRLGGMVVCCSESEKAAYEKIGVSANYINNAVNIRPDQPAVNPATVFTVVTSGRIAGQKNPLLFNQIAEYFADLPDVKFVWVGDGELKSLLTAPNIMVTGWLTEAEANDRVEKADLYLSTSTYEGLSFSVLEALSCKKPVLLSQVNGNTDILTSGVHGDLFKTPEQAICKIIQYYNNREMLEVMGEYSKEVCETRFNRAINFSHYRSLYQSQTGS